MRANLVAIEIVGTEIPFTIPAVLLNSFNHSVDALLSALSFFLLAHLFAKLYVLLTRQHEEAGNHQRFGFTTHAVVLSGLERLIRIP